MDFLQQIINFRAFQINRRLVADTEMAVHLPHEELKETAVDSVTNTIDKKNFADFRVEVSPDDRRSWKELVQNHVQWRASI